LVGLVEGCVRACVEGEAQKKKADAEAGAKPNVIAAGGQIAVNGLNGGEEGSDGDDEADQGAERKGGDQDKAAYEALREHKERDDWLVRTERFVCLAAETAGELASDLV
jgi:nucleolar pre-ribosomal-associated protein 1